MCNPMKEDVGELTVKTAYKLIPGEGKARNRKERTAVFAGRVSGSLEALQQTLMDFVNVCTND